jgi:hypothetical protein
MISPLTSRRLVMRIRGLAHARAANKFLIQISNGDASVRPSPRHAPELMHRYCPSDNRGRRESRVSDAPAAARGV